MDKIRLNIYGVSIAHPRDWQIFINPNNKFTFHEGLIKLDKVKGNTKSKKTGTNQTTLSIRWATMKEDVDLNDYIAELGKQFEAKEKKSRNKDRYKIVESKQCTIDGGRAYFLHNQFVANHSIYRFFGKDELVETLQVVFYSENTKRMMVASLLTTTEELKKNEELYKEILASLSENINDEQYANQNSHQISQLRLVENR